jgi:hypothetical protein
MRKLVLLIAVAVAVLATVSISTRAQIVSTAVRCLHQGGPEREADRVRREQAIVLVKAIMAAEGQALQQTRSYKPLAELSGLPATPDAFRLRFYVNDDGFVASLKDERDPCYFGIFADQSGFVYMNSPVAVPFVASAH